MQLWGVFFSFSIINITPLCLYLVWAGHGFGMLEVKREGSRITVAGSILIQMDGCVVVKSECPWRRQFSGCVVPSLPLLPLPAAQAGCRGSGMTPPLAPPRRKLALCVHFIPLLIPSILRISVSARSDSPTPFPGWPRNTRITWHSIKNTP